MVEETFLYTAVFSDFQNLLGINFYSDSTESPEKIAHLPVSREMCTKSKMRRVNVQFQLFLPCTVKPNL